MRTTKCIAILSVVLFGCDQGSSPQNPAPQETSVESKYAARNRFFGLLQSNVLQIKPLPADDEKLLWGTFSSGPGLSGEVLYVFPDRSYCFTKWADTWPETIHEEGNWEFKDGLVVMSRDGSLPKDSGARDHTYLPFRICHRGSETVAIVGTQDQLQRFAEVGQYLHIFIYRKDQPIAQDNGERLKKELLKRCWRPEAFKP
jgi:hypothetical protein